MTQQATSDATLIRHWRTTIDEFVFVYRGGEYIHVSVGAEPPIDVINVWDYAAQQRTIATRPEFVDRCREWMQRADDWRREGYGR